MVHKDCCLLFVYFQNYIIIKKIAICFMDSTLRAFPSSSYHKQAFFGIPCEKFNVSQSVHQSVKAFSAFPTNQLYANKPPRGIMISVHKFASESFRNVVGTLHPRYNLNSKQQTLLHNDILKATAVHTSLGPGRQNVILQVQESGRSLGKMCNKERYYKNVYYIIRRYVDYIY